MTFSIVGRGADGAAWGVAVASKFLAVGAAVPAAEAGVGALATQAQANLAYRHDGLRLLAEGRSGAQVIDALTSADAGRDARQVGVVARDGSAATFTGSACHGWAGGVSGGDFAIQGNILVGPEVVASMRTAWLAGNDGRPLARRLLQALQAGDAAGGDRRGRQSAALLVAEEGGGYGGSSDIAVDLRVDDAPRPVEELARLLSLHELYFGRPDPATLLPLEGALADEVARRLGGLGYATLDDWAGVENYEERMADGSIDPVVLAKLREATG
jgi:uncharacterized Ntn-hydrolase superfamily protein